MDGDKQDTGGQSGNKQKTSTTCIKDWIKKNPVLFSVLLVLFLVIGFVVFYFVRSKDNDLNEKIKDLERDVLYTDFPSFLHIENYKKLFKLIRDGSTATLTLRCTFENKKKL